MGTNARQMFSIFCNILDILRQYFLSSNLKLDAKSWATVPEDYLRHFLHILVFYNAPRFIFLSRKGI